MINNDELLLVVDENNEPLLPKPRSEVHSNGYWHRTSHVWVVNSKGQILCQRRSLKKDSNPGKMEPFFGGHISPSVEYIDCAVAETFEELGISAAAEDFKFWKVYKFFDAKEFQGVFVLKFDGDIDDLKIEKEEIDGVFWEDLSELKPFLTGEQNSEWTMRTGYEEDLLEYIQREILN